MAIIVVAMISSHVRYAFIFINISDLLPLDCAQHTHYSTTQSKNVTLAMHANMNICKSKI